MRTFFARRYARPIDAVGSTEKVLGLLILLLLAGIVVAFVGQVVTNEDDLFGVDETAYRGDEGAREVAVAGEAMPSLDDLGWQAPKRVSRYTPENLYQKIDGRADAYLQFHVVGLTFGTYRHGTDAERMVDVYWYDMGEPDNAFGMYRCEASPEAAAVSIGQGGYETGGAVFFWKGPSYVQVLPASFEADDTGIALKVAERLAERIEASDDDRWALSVLPQAGRVEDSFKYIARDAFGLDFLTEVFAADYDLAEGRMTLFVRRSDDGVGATELFDRYVTSIEKYGRIVWRSPDASRPIIGGEVADVIDVVFTKGRYLAGVTGAEDVEAAKKAAVAFYEGLTAP